MAIGDVPVSGLALRGREATLSNRLCSLLLSDDLLSVTIHDGGQIEFGALHGGCLNCDQYRAWKEGCDPSYATI